MKRLNKIITIVLFAFIVLPNIINAELFPKSRYRTKGWWYFKRLEGGAGLPPYVYGSILSVGAGFSPPFGFGAGITFAEATGPFTLIVHSDVEEESDTLSEIFWGELPISLFWVPWLHIPNPDSLKFTVLYLFFRASILRQIIGEPYEEYRLWHLRGGIGLEHSFLPFWLNLGIEAGYRWLSFDYKVGIAQSSSPYVALTLFVGSWGPIKVHTLPSPSLHLFASFYDADGNNVLSDNEEGKLVVTISNKGKGKAKDTRLTFSILEEEFRDKIFCENYYSIGDIEPMGQKKVEVKIKAKTELPRGKFNIMITSHYKTELDKEDKKVETYTINTMPASQIAEQKEEQLTKPVFHFPPDLSISHITFSESSGNKALDAYEDGEISFIIENKGKGKAEGVSIRVTQVSGEGVIEYPKQLDIGSIPAGSQKIVKIPIKSQDKTKNEIVKLRIGIYEELGFDADPFTISFETREFVPPALMIASVSIDDDREGDSYGDNDGIIEPGEQIEVSLAIQNKGRGDAKNTKVEITIPDEGQQLYFNSPTREFNLGNIISGDYRKIDFVLTLTKRYDKENILIKARMEEATGKGSGEDSVYLPVGKPSGYGKEIIVVAEKEEPKKELESLSEGIDIEQPINRYGQPKQNRLCIIIGIEEYKIAPKSLYSNRDAQIFYQYARDVLGVQEKNIYITINENATKGEFDKIFGENGWLERRVNKESEVFIYFSGHGSVDIKKQKQYLIPYDIDPNYPQVAYSLDKIYECLSRMEVKKAVIFLDACFTGQSREGTLILAGIRPLLVSELSKPSQNITVFTAASGNEIASIYSEKKHGLFTYYLLKGLRGDADLNKDNIITIKELFNYIKDKVSETALEMDREQHPQLLGTDEGIVVRFR